MDSISGVELRGDGEEGKELLLLYFFRLAVVYGVK